MKQFEGKVAVVTGGTQGLGAAIATLFAQRGARGIVICGRSVERGEAKARAIEREFGTEVTFVAADLSRVDDCRAVIAAAAGTFGRVDTLVNAAAMTDRGTILDTTPERFDEIFATNVRAPFFLMQDAIRLMRETRTQGTIVNICSMSSKAGQPFIVAYCASKGALATLTRNTAFALLKNRIRVNALNVGWMASEGEDRIMRTYHDAKDGWLDEAAARLPFGRLIDPCEVARAVAFLATDESGLMTGSVVDYDQSVWGGYEEAPMPSALL
ncbi:SDR family oxidoreductase [Burkholderia sp. MSMB1835]|uniref:SDR family oxidoreductase n=1 Tax=Burkholderia sp. MSMB1835 TaxID=1637876 RepID=UPI00075D3902|nr:SDR family oxidoreductase [Burkholderia sp. MSMB1835]KVL27359.1 short-chain dehydrogenase [Burkholderia sp. MSMB1835]